ncbi:chondroitin sulfate glucuronyltransferase-like [Orbicella faveolata]|uniref:chondroitin sulfate glucuronyltransferase-like n=1 Tax=Orbicella faveolata TaxID=48498 RepID=UPI0009E18F91|nr:chondroitin sulfate glucuronyltransferase-like [Orbicella faveolata]
MATFHRKTHPHEALDGGVNRTSASLDDNSRYFSGSTSFSRKMKSVRGMRFRPVIPAIIGVSLGFALSMFYIPVVEQQCLYDLEESQVLILGHQKQPGDFESRKTTSEESKPVVHNTVPPKVTHFSYGLRPFYVASELGHRDKLLVGILTSEENIDSLVLAVNNTWAPLLPKIIFFTPFSRDVDFYEKYSKVLGLPIVQLADVEDENFSKTKMSFKMLKYMHDHYANNFEWFMRVEDAMYLKPEKLVELLNSVNSSKDVYLGRPGSFRANGGNGDGDLYTHEKYCQGGAGVALSRSALMKLVPHLDSCLEDALTEHEDVELGRCLFKNVRLQCTWSYETSELFYHIPKDSESNDIINLIKERRMSRVISLHPVTDPLVMYKMHRYYTELELNRTFVETRTLQNVIKDMLPYLPDGVPEKRPSWPIGFRQPFKPQSRFEVLQWEYFTDTSSYGFTEVNPKVPLRGDYKRDVEDVKETAIKMLSREYSSAQKEFRLINGYRRVDPRRGAEYILDIGIKNTGSKEDSTVRRVHLLRPYTRVESIQMPTAIEQRGIHLVLPVTRGDTDKLDEFLQMYQKVCLQTGENVVLLTVFVNVRDGTIKKTGEDPFAGGKALIARYKQKYTWAQLPWIQIGVRYNSVTLLMDIVTMKLPANALIFLTALRVEFNVNFLNRCRVNALSGEQVFFPIPFAYYDPSIVYRQRPVPDVIPVHRDTGRWAQGPRDMACFDNKDYKDLRMSNDDFLKEHKTPALDLMEVFSASPLHVFQAVDIDLRKRFQNVTCDPHLKEDEYNECLTIKAEGMASRSQLALLMFEMEQKIQGNGATEVHQLR